MAHTRYHRRHHTWPHCGSELCMREPGGVEIHISKPGNGPASYISGSFQQAVPASFMPDELLCDDMGMPELTRQPRRPRLWFRSNKERNEQISLSGSPGQTRNTYRSVLRRLTRRPPLNKSRSLFVVPSNVGAGDAYIRRGWIPPGVLAQQAGVSGFDGRRLVGSGAYVGRVAAERRHRRCHSEQPRAWRRPSATLWTLQEHEE
ncbi:hypothetical protein N7457_008733 [Penicillium paradoxum]|uniref:uncharacterized protein n=1 Tax=Penicillium paradoxum TaxID=176176 RepID=UPI00254959E7|nr:uncharacterized protein N7457_008733 [Penicillium paradoxum]KAJ5773837.1 hypothetical protein N7457_008733 [Penicillium paradoxum]